MKLFTFIFTLLLTLTVIRPIAAQDDDPPRTAYDALDLSSPEAAVTAFSDAFQREDFFTVFMVMHLDAQFRFIQTVQLFQFDQLYDTTYQEEVEADIPLFSTGFGTTEHMPVGPFLFDDLMLAAATHDALLIDLRGAVEILDNMPNEITDDDEIIEVVDVVASVEGIEGQVIFRMMQAPSGKWRVLQVIVPGGDEELLPWAVPQD